MSHRWPLGAQTELMLMVMRMKPGQCCDIDGEMLRDAEREDSPSLLFWRQPSRDEWREFLAKLEQNWEIRLFERVGQDTWTVSKQAPPPRWHWADNGYDTCTAELAK